MLDLFHAVGAMRFHITFTDIRQNPTGFRPAQSLVQVRNSMQSSLLGNCANRGTNVIIRPLSETTQLVQLDDLKADQLERLRPLAFLILVTSPGNHQAWLAISDPLPKKHDAKDFVRRLKKGVGAVDRLASGSVRIAGSLNFKEDYRPEKTGQPFPRVTIAEASPGRTVTRAQLEGLGLVAAPEAPKAAASAPVRVSRSRRLKRWPNYEMTLAGAPKSNSGGHKRSIADFVWCMTAIDWGHGVEETAAELLKVSTKAHENGEGYALMTAENAAAALDRQQGQNSARRAGERYR